MCGPPVRDVGPLLHQGGDDPAQRQQRLVDVPGLAGPLVHSSGAADVLAAGEVHLDRSGSGQYTGSGRSP